MLNYLPEVILFAAAVAVVLAPQPEPPLLIPERRRRRQRRADRASLEEATTIAWLGKVKDVPEEAAPAEPVRSRQVTTAHLPPWGEALPPSTLSPTMVTSMPGGLLPAPLPRTAPALTPLPVTPEVLPPADKPWATIEEPEPEPEAEPEPEEDSRYSSQNDPPTIVRGLRAVLDKDLGPYLENLPTYDDKG